MGNIMYAILALLLAATVTSYFVYFQDNFNPESVRGKRVLITGASSGIGRQLAFNYSMLGARVVVAARRENELKDVVAECKKLGALQAEYLVIDFAKPEDRDRTMKQTLAMLGGLDHLILNHIVYRFGYWMGSDKNMTDMLSDMNINFFSYADLAFKAIRPLSESNGNIGIISSIDAKYSIPYEGTHALSKHALQGLFGTLYHDLRIMNTGVSVTTFIFGPIATTYKREDVSYFGMHGASPAEAAVEIIKGVTSRAREIVYPLSIKIGVFVYKFFPTWLEEYSFNCFKHLLIS